MELVVSLTGTHNRKELANLIADVAFDTTAKYSGTGSVNGYRFAYQIGPLTLTKENALVGFNTLPEDKQEQIAGILEFNGYEFTTISEAGEWGYGMVTLPEGPTVPVEEANETPAETAPVGPTSEETEPAGITAPEAETAPTEARFTVNLANDLTDAQYQNLRNLIEQKENLLDLAFPGTMKQVMRTPEGRLEFRGWFPYDNNGDAYLLFAARMVDMAKAAKRVSTKQNPVTNPKYQFRCFLLRLGFIGKEYGPARKALMKNLSGNSAWLRGSKDA